MTYLTKKTSGQFIPDPKLLMAVKKNLESAGLKVTSATLAYVPKVTMPIVDEAQQEKVMKFMDILDELEDVVETYTNFDIE